MQPCFLLGQFDCGYIFIEGASEVADWVFDDFGIQGKEAGQNQQKG